MIALRRERTERPGSQTEASQVSLTGDTQIVSADDRVWCQRCGALLTAPRSVERELGPVCVHLVTEAVAS
ncbi:DUF6011 domain-containing protein [uncultured Nocardioides sp.]|uniref:DUF6011 domain-containing protein n=1 Tax=uncultured Nocardioides sp. TaxID=198441 RepID=UPI00345479B3